MFRSSVRDLFCIILCGFAIGLLLASLPSLFQDSMSLILAVSYSWESGFSCPYISTRLCWHTLLAGLLGNILTRVSTYMAPAASFIRPVMFHSTVLLYPKCRLVVAHMAFRPCRPPISQSARRSFAGNRLLQSSVPPRPTFFTFSQCGCASFRRFAGDADASDDRSVAVLRRKHTIRRRRFSIVVCAGRYCRKCPLALPIFVQTSCCEDDSSIVFLSFFFFEADESMSVCYSPC